MDHQRGADQDILNHFDSAVHLGLTATPKRDDNVDTYDYFGEPVYIYSLKEGIQDGFLTPFKVKRIQTTIDEYVYTPDDEVLDGEVEEGHVYTENDFNTKIVIEARERKRVQDMLAAINQKQKTLAFCANQAHAALIRDLINQEPIDTGGGTSGTGGNDGNGGNGGDDDDDGGEGTKPKKLKIRLADGKVRELQSMTSTYFYVDGKPISAEEFLQKLFDTLQLPSLFGSEERLREIWANPLTRRDLMSNLEKEGCHKDDLLKLQEHINAEDSDLFDVLQYIAYAKETVSRATRVETNKDNIYNLLNAEQREFISYVLRNYVELGADELDISNLSTVINAKYGNTHAAQQKLGNVQDIQRTFIEFQEHLYKEAEG